ncbi:TetR/AcrR family transcriptional regulator [Streptomyces sp. NPDC052396]|uniref:TetR/AcrR family transcriptional regulator n=1 Tax=Streptomyces sp. NPDC052396 TaxID=3365689 RepID=UPI0037D8D813
MTEGPITEGLRERKKRRTRQTLSETAIALFLEHGFDRVSVADVAAAAEVSKPTLFRYFPSKEDLVLHRIADHQGEAAQVVRERAPDQPAVAALRAHFHAGLDNWEPVTGLCDIPAVAAFRDMLYTTPALVARLPAYTAVDEQALAEALWQTAGADELTARLAAVQIIAVQHLLARDNWRRLSGSRSREEMLREAHREADAAFGLLESGLSRQLR